MTSLVHRVPGLMAALTFALCAQNPLAVRTTLPSPACGHIFTIGDFDSSGLPDYLVLTGTGTAPVIGVVHDPIGGSGSCTTTPMTGIPSANYLSARAADLNADAHLDAIISFSPIFSPNLVVVAYGTGNGDFVFPGTGPYAVSPATDLITVGAVADLDANGRDDVVVVRGAQGQFGVVEVFLNLTTGWTLSLSYASTTAPSTLFGVGDVDGNGTVDLAWTDGHVGAPGQQSRLRIARGLGSGAFAVDPLALPIGPIDIHVSGVADLDSDGFDDVVMTNSGLITGSPEPVRVAYGVPLGAPTIVNVPTPFDALRNPTVLDFDDDGILDILLETYFMSNAAVRPVVLLRGLGARQFSAPIQVGTESFSAFTNIRFHAVDTDGDRDLDVIRTEVPWFAGANVIQLYDNQTIYAPGCAGTGGLAPAMTVGTATPDNPAFAIGVEDALPNAGAVLGVSLARVPVSGCGIGLNLGLANLVLPSGSLGLAVTDLAGEASIGLPIPAGLSGATFYAQWGVADPQGALSFAGQSFALSDARTLYVF